MQMKDPTIKRRERALTNCQPQGFALVVTLTLMVLLTILALGLLSLSAVTLRSSASGNAMSEARQNARLSLILAIGKLQSLAGQDTRVTANASLLSENNVPLTGVWRSWEGSDRDASGKPKAPDYTTKSQPADPSAPPQPNPSGRFLGWLASTNDSNTPDTTNFTGASSTATSDSVPLLASGGVSDPAEEIHLIPTRLPDADGAIAWFASGENSKAMVNKDPGEKPATPVEWISRNRSNGRPDPATFSLEKVASAAIIPGTASLALVDTAADKGKFHDLTGYATGLLTNTATGGWKKDLSLLSEGFSSLPADGLPLFTAKPGQVTEYAKAQPSSHAPKALLYPWANYRADPSRPAWAQVPPICSWSALADFATQWNSLSTSAASRTSMPAAVSDYGSSGNRFQWQERVRRSPQLARIHWIYSLCSTKSEQSNDPGNPDKWGKYRPALMVTPVVTLWNPYNIELTVSSFRITLQETSPIQFTFKVGANTYRPSSLSEITSAGSGYFRFDLKINQSVTLAPGASRIFGLNDNKPQDNSKANNIVLTPGYKPNGGFLFYGLDKGTKIYAEAGDTFSVEKTTYDATTREGGIETFRNGFGIIYDVVINGSNKAAHRMAYDATEMGGPSVMSALYPPLTDAVSASVSSVEGVRNRPFASAIFAYRMASPASNDPRHNHLASKGMLQTNPLAFYTEIGFGDSSTAITSMAGTGVYHPINAPYDFAFQDVNGWNDTLSIPQFETGTNSSYIVSGLTAGDGLTRCIVAEIPTRPLQSLGELQHFDARNNNPIPPFHFNLIGNGSANPVFAPDQLYVTTSKNDGMCNDDGYLLNHMLFDDWFFSSISPEHQDYGKSVKRSAQKVYEDHLRSKKRLPNRFYIPSPDAAGKSVTDSVADVFKSGKDATTGMFPYETVASKLEVSGMFNINSVSVDAWKALLRQSRDSEVPYYSANGAIQAGEAASFPYPRTSVAGDRATDTTSPISNPLFPDAAEYAGHRVLTEKQIDALAEEIVSEIRKRGPFLSLSEFVNRRVSTDKDLAIAGTIQKALDNLAARGSSPENPFEKLQSHATEITSLPPGNTHDYKFPEAALGSSAFGVPGWIRQADILTPLAPVISARDDTFTIRAYGDSRDAKNPSRILAKAWCEATVSRTAAYVDSTDPAAINPHSPEMKSAANKRYGRRFGIVSFKWLHPDEV